MERIAHFAHIMQDWLKRMLVRLEKCTAFRAFLFLALLVMMAANIYLLNASMPLILDDYDFMFSWATGEKIAGFADVLRSQMVHYQIWGGRMLHVFTQLFLYLGKDVFNVANTVMFMLLLMEIYAIARPAGRHFCWSILLLAYLALMTMLPFFGTVFLWLTGSCIYLFGTVLALVPLLIVRSVREDRFFARGKLSAFLCLPLGILAGWTNENTACGMLALTLVLLVCEYLGAKKHVLPMAMLAVGQCIGVALLLLAPGNAARASVYTYDSMIIELLRRFVVTTAYGMIYLGIPLALTIVLSAVVKKPARHVQALALIFAAVMSVYAMVGSPELSDRTYTGPFVLVLSALLMLAADAQLVNEKLDAARLAALPLVLVFAVYTGYHAVKDVRAYAEKWNNCVAVIEQACLDGAEQVSIEQIDSASRFTMDIALSDQADQWPNSTISKYYGIDIVGL